MDITVTGTGRAALPPERGTLTLTAGFESGDKAEALARTTELVRRLSEHIGRLKQDEAHPVTWWAVHPIATRSWRPWSDRGEVLPLRHAASSLLRAKFRDFHELAVFADRWGGVEGVTLGGVEWTLTRELHKDTESTVLARAYDQAHERAQALSDAAEGGPVTCVSIADPGLLTGRPPTEMLAGAAMFARDSAGGGTGEGGIDINPEDVEFQTTVHVRFVTGS